MLVVVILATYWLGRQSRVSPAGAAWFPGREPGLETILLVFGLGALSVAGDVIGRWRRNRGAALLGQSLLQPEAMLLAAVAATSASLLPLAALLVFWPSLGAWRVGEPVLWSVPLLFMACGAVPILLAGAAAGLLGQTITKGGAAGFFLSLVLLVPVWYFRTRLAPLGEILSLGTIEFGLLVPRERLLLEALLTCAPGLAAIGVAMLMMPAGPALARGRALVRGIAPRLRLLRRPLAVVGCLMVVVAAPPLGKLLRAFEGGAFEAWPGSPPPGLTSLVLPAPRIVDRRIRLAPSHETPARIQLTLAAEAPITHVALRFGPALRVPSSGGAEVIRRGPGGWALLRMEPALGPGERRTLDLAPQLSQGGHRLWDTAWSGRFTNLGAAGPWYGEVAAVDFRDGSMQTESSPSPWSVELPTTSPGWQVTGATQMPGDAGWIVARSTAPSIPHTMLSARLTEFPTPPELLFPLRLHLHESRRELVNSLSIAWTPMINRLGLLFGREQHPVDLWELPATDSITPLAFSTEQLNELEDMIVDYDRFVDPTKPAVQRVFERVNREVVGEVLRRAHPVAEPPELLREAFSAYIHLYGLDAGRVPPGRQTSPLNEWRRVRRGSRPFDIPAALEPVYTRPALTMAADGTHPVVPVDTPPLRLLAFHHQLRGFVGEGAFAATVRDLASADGSTTLTLERYREALERHSGESLQFFFDQWLREGVLPELRITSYTARQVALKESRTVAYQCEIEVQNLGSGRVAVPWALATEGDALRGRVWLEPGGKETLTLASDQRPVAFELDPDNWVLQKAPKKQKDQDDPRRAVFRTIIPVMGD